MAKGSAHPKLDVSTEGHIFGELGFASVDEYRRWCTANCLRSSVRKSDLQRRQERELLGKQAADRALRTARRSHNPAHAIERIFGGEIDEQTITDEPLRIVAQACSKQTALPGLPAPLTKRMAHWFTQAPDHYSRVGAIRYGQVRALGGDRRVTEAILGTRVARDFRDNQFWLELIRFFARNPMLDTAHYQPIVDYIWNQKYENQAVFVARGVVQETGPLCRNVRLIVPQARLIDLVDAPRDRNRRDPTAHRGTRRQARGLRNRLPDAKEMGVLHRWSRAAGLAVAPWVATEP